MSSACCSAETAAILPEAKAGRPRDPGILPGENQVIGKEVKKTTQKSAEGAVRDTSAAQAARDASINRDFDRVVCTRHLIHDWPVLSRVGQIANVLGSHP